MKSLIAFMCVVLQDLEDWCCTSTTQDRKTVLRRVEHEGLSFLTITLSTFGKDFQKSLDLGYVGHDRFAGFSRHGGLPRFLGGFLDLVFDRTTGRLLDVPSVDAIRAIRQFTLMWAKIEIDCSPERIKAAFDAYVECEQDLRRSDAFLASELDFLQDFERLGALLWADFLSCVDSRIYNDGVTPRHGPGATSDKLRGNAKYNQRTWPSRLESVFPYWENSIPSESAIIHGADVMRILEPRDEIPVRVISVPKTLETPRIIAVEPTAMQYMQQGVLNAMMEQIPRFDNTRNLVMFESNEPNQRLAREGSMTGALATLDLSEASDRVSNQHVRLLVSRFAALRAAVDATRSRKADVPGHGVIRLTKFASMGSALTFPMEALVFMTIVFIGIERSLKRRLTKKDVESFYGRVRAYGDDIIVPVEHVQSVIGCLEAFGLKVNRNKSFWTGKFRESCGSDWYDGHDVRVVRVRQLLPDNRQQAERVISAVSLRNQLWNKGLFRSVDFLDARIEKIIPFPYVEPTSPVLGREGFSPCKGERLDPNTHVPLVKGCVVRAVPPASLLDGYGALLKFFLNAPRRRVDDVIDVEHLQRAGRAGSVNIKTGWAPIR